MKVYYDTNVLIAFLCKRNLRNHEYSPWNLNIEAYISFLAFEEALYVLFFKKEEKKLPFKIFKKDSKKWFKLYYGDIPEKEAYEKFIMDLLASPFKLINNIDSQKVLNKVTDIIDSFQKAGYNWLKKGKPKPKDIFHIAIADFLCETFLTTDDEFKKFCKLKGVYSFENLKEIVILDKNNYRIKRRIEL